MIQTRKSHLTRFIAICALLLTTGCVVGPNFKRPAAPTNGGYTPVPPPPTSITPNVSGGETQGFVEGSDISGEWWT